MNREQIAYMLLGRFVRDRALGTAVTNAFWVMRLWEVANTQAMLWCAGVRDERIHPWTHEMMQGIEIIERTE